MAGKGKEAEMNKKQKRNLMRIIVAAILMIVLHFAPVSGMVRFGLYLVPYLIIGYDILWKAFKGVKNRQPFDESLLMAIATLGRLSWLFMKTVIIRKPLALCFSTRSANGSRAMPSARAAEISAS